MLPASSLLSSSALILSSPERIIGLDIRDIREGKLLSSREDNNLPFRKIHRIVLFPSNHSNHRTIIPLIILSPAFANAVQVVQVVSVVGQADGTCQWPAVAAFALPP
jgi:hypothetical protein